MSGACASYWLKSLAAARNQSAGSPNCMGNEAFIWALFGFCLALSFFLSGMEAGVFALSRLRIRQQMRAGLPSAKVLYNYLENPENFLWTILVGNTVANLLILGWLVVVALKPMIDHLAWYAMLLLLAGGLVYSTGVIFYVNKRLKFARAIWHGHVVAAAATHWTAVLLGVVLAAPASTFSP